MELYKTIWETKCHVIVIDYMKSLLKCIFMFCDHSHACWIICIEIHFLFFSMIHLFCIPVYFLLNKHTHPCWKTLKSSIFLIIMLTHIFVSVLISRQFCFWNPIMYLPTLVAKRGDKSEKKTEIISENNFFCIKLPLVNFISMF